MVKRIIGLLAVFLLAQNVFASNIQLEEDIALLGKILQVTNSFTADFVQTIKVKKTNKIQTVTGKVAIKKPGLLRWQVIQPDPNLLIIDGKKVWNYDEELQQVTVDNFDADNNNSPVSLFLGADIQQITKKYRIKKTATAASKQGLKINFVLIPMQKNDSFNRVELIFANNIIEQLILTDNLDQTSTIKFNNINTNTNLTNDLFNFTPPKGVDIVGTQE